MTNESDVGNKYKCFGNFLEVNPHILNNELLGAYVKIDGTCYYAFVDAFVGDHGWETSITYNEILGSEGACVNER